MRLTPTCTCEYKDSHVGKHLHAVHSNRYQLLTVSLELGSGTVSPGGFYNVSNVGKRVTCELVIEVTMHNMFSAESQGYNFIVLVGRCFGTSKGYRSRITTQYSLIY